MRRNARRQTSPQNARATQLRFRASNFRWAAKSAKSSFAQEELLGLAISLEAEADELEFHVASDEQPNGETRLSASGL
jgi:hypothetical protein